MESRLRQIRIAKPSSPVLLVTEAFVTKWNQRIPIRSVVGNYSSGTNKVCVKILEKKVEVVPGDHAS